MLAPDMRMMLDKYHNLAAYVLASCRVSHDSHSVRITSEAMDVVLNPL